MTLLRLASGLIAIAVSVLAWLLLAGGDLSTVDESATEVLSGLRIVMLGIVAGLLSVTGALAIEWPRWLWAVLSAATPIALLGWRSSAAGDAAVWEERAVFLSIACVSGAAIGYLLARGFLSVFEGAMRKLPC